jgi:FtsH-binding integral membrane protein
MSSALYGRPLSRSSAEERVAYLKRVMLWTTGGLMLSGFVAAASTVALFLLASAGITLVFNQIFMLVVIFGAWGISNFVAPRMIQGSAKAIGFGLGTAAQGVAMSYLLLAAISMGLNMGSPFGLVGLAAALTGLTGVGLTAYVMTGPKNFSFLGGALAALSIPMLLLMGVGLVFPAIFGGTIGIILSGVFVAISVGGLLYQLNQVLHRYNTDEHVAGAYDIAIGVLVLFWNILSLLMKLTRR